MRWNAQRCGCLETIVCNSRDYQYHTLFFLKKNLEGMFKDVDCDKRKNVLDSIIYECKCRMADPQFGCVGTLLELKQRCDYLEGVVYYLLAHNQEVLMSTLACCESHPIDFYQSNHQVLHIPNIEGFGFPLIAFPPFYKNICMPKTITTTLETITTTILGLTAYAL